MNKTLEYKKEVTILFAGDSGDGIQLTGNQFTDTTALFGNDVSTFPTFPAEIRAPQGTVAGVSGFQLQFGSSDLYSPGDMADVLVVMNAAALKANLTNLKKGGIVIANIAGFDNKNLKLAGYDSNNPLQGLSNQEYRIHEIDITWEASFLYGKDSFRLFSKTNEVKKYRKEWKKSSFLDA